MYDILVLDHGVYSSGAVSMHKKKKKKIFLLQFQRMYWPQCDPSGDTILGAKKAHCFLLTAIEKYLF